ncbi:hypothetical protein OAS37_07425 [Alphaproteobacteria bacterium]|nr:hypothetical protein [Alphaproteobacteria bacterium]
MFKFLNKDWYCTIFLHTEDSDSNYITNIIRRNSPQYKNSYNFYFNLDGHKDWKFSGSMWWYKTEKECLQWIKFNWDQSSKRGKEDTDKCFRTFSNSITMFDKIKYLKDFFLNKDFSQSPLSFYMFNKEKLKKYEFKNGKIPNENPLKYVE